MTSALFRHIETLQGDAPWGDVLDAGTGVNSALWSRTLNTRSWTGVSGASGHLAQVRERLGSDLGENDRLVLGNWTDPALLSGMSFDTVLADYLLGAIEGFSPYFQSELFGRLRPLARGRLYVVGLDPYVVGPVATDSDRMVRAIGRMRDSVLLMADETPYREYPMEWTVRALSDAGFQVDAAKRFPNRYQEKWVHSQLDMALRRVGRTSAGLGDALTAEIERLRAEAVAVCSRDDGLRSGHDYVVAARIER